MSDRDTFLRAIAAAPHDILPVQIYADWCDDHGVFDDDAMAARLARRFGLTNLSGRNIDEVYGFVTDATAVAAKTPIIGIPRIAPGDTALVYSSRVAAWVAANRAAIVHADARMRRQAAWKAEAADGVASAALAHPTIRMVIGRLARGEKPCRHLPRPSECTTRKALAAAKAILVSREQRRQDRQVAEAARTGPPPGQWADRALARRRFRAVAIGVAYHESVRPLYRSQYADVVYGRGGQMESDRERYSKNWHSQYGPATCRMAGARLDSESRPTCVILENHLGTEVARVPYTMVGAS